MKKLIYGLFLGLLTITLVSCGGGEKTVTISPVGNQMKYDVTSFEVKAGQTVTVIMDNKATMAVMKHNVVILNDQSAINRVGQAAVNAKDNLPEDAAIIAATPMADAGQVTEVTFTAPSEPGEYPYICTYPGHYSLMQGVMIVK